MIKSSFFCDVTGTFTSSEGNRSHAVTEFVKLLDQLVSLDGVEKMYFSFVTSEGVEYLKKFVEEIKPYLQNTKVKLGIQYAANSILIDGLEFDGVSSKQLQILSIIRDYDVNTIYYADDTLLNQIIVKRVINVAEPNVNLTQFFPGNSKNIDNQELITSELNGLKGVNESISNYIKKRSKLKTRHR